MIPCFDPFAGPYNHATHTDMSTLLVLLPPPRPGSSDIDDTGSLTHALSDDGQSVARGGQTSAALLPVADEIVAVVPPQALSWHRVDLPRMPAHRFAQGLQSVMEDRLLASPEQTHLVCAPGHKPGQSADGLWVAACDRAWLTAALASVEAAGRKVNRIAPLLSPSEPGSLTLVLSGAGQAWACTRTEAGVHTCPLSLHTELGLPSAKQVQAEPALAALASRSLGPAGRDDGPKVDVVAAAHLLVHALKNPWDLAQGDYNRQSERGAQAMATGLRRFWQERAWRPARWALLGAVAAHLIGLNLWAWQEHRDMSHKQSRMQQILQQSFPNVPLVAEPHLLMARETRLLAQKLGQAEASGLEAMLALAGQFNAAGASPAEIEFNGSRLTLRQFTPSAADKASLDKAAEERGLKLTQQGADLLMEVRP